MQESLLALFIAKCCHARCLNDLIGQTIGDVRGNKSLPGARETTSSYSAPMRERGGEGEVEGGGEGEGEGERERERERKALIY